MKEQQKYTIEELAGHIGFSIRTIRYYTQKELISRPIGTGKGAYYTDIHREQLYTIKHWKNAGLSLAKIKEMLSEGDPATQLTPPRRRQKGQVESWTRMFVCDGLELHVEPRRAALTAGDIKQIFASLQAAYEKTRTQRGDE